MLRLPTLVSLSMVGVACLAAGCDGPPPVQASRTRLAGHSVEVVALAFSPDGKTLASRGGDAVKVWDVHLGRQVASFTGDGSNFGAVAISPDGKTVASTIEGRGVVTWDWRSGRELALFRRPPRPGDPPSNLTFGLGIAYSPDGKTLAGPNEDQGPDQSSILLWDVATGTSEGVGPPGSPATHLAFTPDGRSLLSKGISGYIRAWDLQTRGERTSMTGAASYLASLVISLDGKVVASSDTERLLRLWSVASGDALDGLKGHRKAILGIAFHPSGRFVATGDAGGTIYLWDLARRRPIADFEGHQGKVWALVISPDGRTMASAGEDTTIRLWNLDPVVQPAGR